MLKSVRNQVGGQVLHRVWGQVGIKSGFKSCIKSGIKSRDQVFKNQVWRQVRDQVNAEIS
jgi:hypothetical protein